ncbi:MAG: betaine/proline/choline family ABC transporter ATP-binding protein [Pseudomonadota bacterium]
MMGSESASRVDESVKLSCRDVWKVYGGNPSYYFDTKGYEIRPAELAARMRTDGAIPAAANVSFDVHVGEIFVIMGLSGSGKSTVVRCLSRLVEPTHGEILLDGDDLLKASAKELIQIRRHKMGMVFQNFGLLPHLTVMENIAFPLKLQGLNANERRDRAARVIDLVGLTGRETSFPRQLSGGQQQRVGIARSLAVEPELWFLDEPFSALDPLIRRQMQDEFLRIQQVLKKSIVFITHDFLEALRIADRMMIMRDGMVVQIGTPAELIVNPADDYVAEFTGDVPMVRVLTAGDVMDPAVTATSGDTSQRRCIDARTTVEDLLPELNRSDRGLTVMRDGSAIGAVTARSVIGALARESESAADGSPASALMTAASIAGAAS